MKKYILAIILLSIASAAFAIFINDFKSWDDLIKRSPDIIIARCIGAPGSAITEKPMVIIDGMVHSDIEVVSVLKGNAKLGPSHLASQYWPYAGEEFLLFGSYENDQFYQGYTAVEDYRVVPMSRYPSANDYLLTKKFPGKTLRQKIRLILDNRLKDLNEELARDNAEKKRLEMSVTTNAP